MQKYIYKKSEEQTPDAFRQVVKDAIANGSLTGAAKFQVNEALSIRKSGAQSREDHAVEEKTRHLMQILKASSSEGEDRQAGDGQEAEEVV